LCCVLGDKQPDVNNGIWIGRLDAADWWHVPGSESPLPSELGSTLEQLRASRPAWTADGKRFAFFNYKPDVQPEKPGKYLLKLGTLAGRDVKIRLEEELPLRELCWTPGGERLGYLRGADRAELQLLDADEGPATTVAQSVRTFNGWDSAGKQLAFVIADESPYREGEHWALLFTPREDSRNAVCVSTGDGKSAARRLADGWHATFPRWSPDGTKIAVWLTFESPYAVGLGSGTLPPRDPLTLIDVATGKLLWQPVNVREKVQVAHHFLRRHDYAEAWKRYAEIETDPDLATMPELSLYIAHCLNKLGRKAEAQARLERFRKCTPRQIQLLPQGMGLPDTIPLAAIEHLLRESLAVEVYLSLDEPEAMVNYLRQSLKAAAGDESRVGTLIVLGQTLLLLDRRTEYLDLLTGELAPLLLKASPDWAQEKRGLFQTLAILTGLPAASPEFLAKFPTAKIRELPPRWEAMRAHTNDETMRLAIDLLLQAVWKRLGNDVELKKVEARTKVESKDFAKGVDESLIGIRKAKAEMMAWMKLMEQFGQ
jgi:hypothetical protein